PEKERRVAAREPQARRFEGGEERLTLAPVALAHLLDVALVAERGDRRALDELLRRGTRRRAERAQRVPAVERVEIGEPAILHAQRDGDDLGAGEERAALVYRVSRLGHCDQATPTDRDLREGEDRLLRAESRHD